MRRALAAALVVSGLLAAGPAAASSGLRVSLLGQTHTPPAGSAWAYYLRVKDPNGRPWQGTILIEVVTTKGKHVDGVGQFGFNGSTLRANVWSLADRGQTLDFRIRFLAGTKVVDTTTYRVAVR